MGEKCPEAIIIDQCRSMTKVVALVFPSARHTWCLWYILMMFPEKLGGHKIYNKIYDALMDVVYEPLIVDDFELNRRQMLIDFNLEGHESLLSLYDGRKKWVPTFVRDKFWAGMSSTQHSESMNADFDGYVHSTTSLKTLLEQYGPALSDKIEKMMYVVADVDFLKGVVRCQTELALEVQFQFNMHVYTHNMFRKVQDEILAMIYCEAHLVRIHSEEQEYKVIEIKDVRGGIRTHDCVVSYNVSTDYVDCMCRMFRWKGIFCKHALKVLRVNKVSKVPEKYMLRRWRKDKS